MQLKIEKKNAAAIHMDLLENRIKSAGIVIQSAALAGCPFSSWVHNLCIVIGQPKSRLNIFKSIGFRVSYSGLVSIRFLF